MNHDAHTSLADRINRQLREPFDRQRLLSGAVDPDIRRGYRGIEYKHHYDPKDHGDDVIKKVVWRYVSRARKNWLSGHGQSASFYFGVATHFASDGLIVSPSVDEGKHQSGDAAFGRKARALAPPLVPLPEHPSGEDAHQALQALSFGGNTPGDLVDVYVALVRIGYAISTERLPPRCTERLAGATAAGKDEGQQALEYCVNRSDSMSRRVKDVLKNLLHSQARAVYQHRRSRWQAAQASILGSVEARRAFASECSRRLPGVLGLGTLRSSAEERFASSEGRFSRSMRSHYESCRNECVAYEWFDVDSLTSTRDTQTREFEAHLHALREKASERQERLSAHCQGLGRKSSEVVFQLLEKNCVDSFVGEWPRTLRYRIRDWYVALALLPAVAVLLAVALLWAGNLITLGQAAALWALGSACWAGAWLVSFQRWAQMNAFVQGRHLGTPPAAGGQGTDWRSE